MLPMEIAAVRNGVAPIPSAERLMLTVLHLDEKRAELEKDADDGRADYAKRLARMDDFILELRAEIDRLEAALSDADPSYTGPGGVYLPKGSD
jgi:hypothetical protein